MTASEVKPASPHLLRILIEQNETALRGLRMSPPADSEGRRRMTIAELAEQTETLKAKLLAETWRERAPATEDPER